jgi:hypothetical protein
LTVELYGVAVRVGRGPGRRGGHLDRASSGGCGEIPPTAAEGAHDRNENDNGTNVEAAMPHRLGLQAPQSGPHCVPRALLGDILPAGFPRQPPGVQDRCPRPRQAPAARDDRLTEDQSLPHRRASNADQALRLLTWVDGPYLLHPSTLYSVMLTELVDPERGRIEEQRGRAGSARNYYCEFLRRYDRPVIGHRPLVDEAKTAMVRLAGKGE